MPGDKFLNNKGFSYIEMIVSVTVFMFVMLITTSIFQNSILTQRNAIAVQANQESIRYALEVISKELRGATKTDEVCVSVSGGSDTNYKTFNEVANYSGTSDAVHFVNKHGECVQYYLASGRLMISRNALALPITPVSVNITNFEVDIEDDILGATHTTQPNITIYFDVKNKVNDYGRVKMQTTISSRYYE